MPATATVCSESAPAPAPVLELRGIKKRFGAVQALRGVDFEVFPGEVVAVVGDNGAGKSTLIKVVSGAYQADDGAFLWRGSQVSVVRPGDAAALGIQTVYQDLALCDNLDVVSNLFLGRERVRTAVPGLIEPLDEVGMEQRTMQVLEDLGVQLPSIRRPVANLSGGQRQAVAIARAAMWQSELVVLDEPTAALGYLQTRMVLRLIKRLRERGHGVVLVSHNLDNVFDVADRIVVLRLGRRVATFLSHDMSPERVVRAITGTDADASDIDPPDV
jgi:D-xylose transport system ATP-binding protein